MIFLWNNKTLSFKTYKYVSLGEEITKPYKVQQATQAGRKNYKVEIKKGAT
jgi:hypothetical protein